MDIVIKLHLNQIDEECLCGELVQRLPGLWMFVEDTWLPVCPKCGDLNAPSLSTMVRLYDQANLHIHTVAAELNRISRMEATINSTISPLDELNQEPEDREQ
jgi:hypothetical protein